MLDSLLNDLARDPAADVDVATVALLLAVDEYPDLDPWAYVEQLHELGQQARPWVVGELEEAVAGLATFLFEEMEFQRNADDYYDPRNSYLNDVLDRRIGLPITLSVVAMSVGKLAGLHVVGVGLPGHFIAKAVRDGEEVLFDPFNGGQILTPTECEHLIESATGRPITATPELLAATPPGMIVARMLNNLRGIYTKDEDFPRLARVLGRMRQLDPRDVHLRRDLGAVLLRTGKPGAAIDHLNVYLEASPYAHDTVAVKELLARAMADVARWN